MPDFLSLERHNNSPEIVAPKEIKMNLVPTVPSTNVDYVQGKMTLNRENYLKDMLNRGNSESAAPLYEYKTAQEERYNNPYMQFTPQIQGSYSSEDAYGKNQGPGEQLYNGLVKMGATAGSAFISGFTSIPNQIDALRQGRVSDALFASDSAFSETQRWMEELENKFPNYMTQVEQDRSWIVNAFTPTGAANFWGDTILKNSGFTIGAIANAVVVDSALELLSSGAATPATLILAGKQISNALTPLKNAYRSLAKVSSLGKVDDLMGVAKASEGLLKGLEVTNKAFGFKKASQLLATTYMSSQGEAMIEGYHTYVDTKTKLLEDALNKGKELTPEYLRGIEETASAAGKVTAMMNTAILSVSNLVQFPKILGWSGGSDILEKVSGKYLGIEVGEQGLIAVNNWTKKAGVKQVLKDTILKGFVSEGAEEGSQYYIGNTLHDYYIDKFNGKAKKDMLGYMTDAIPKTLQDGDFWKESLIGGLSGMITGSVIPGGEIQNSIKTNLYGKHSQYAEHLQRGLDQFNQGVASMVDLDENLSLEGVDKRQASYKALNRAVQTAAKFGSLDTLKESLNDLRELPLDEYNKMFLSEPLKSERDKIEHINRVSDEIDRIEKDTQEVAKTYKNNPFATSKMKEILKAKFKVDDKMVLGIQEKMFEDWKENQSYLIGRIRNTRKTSKNLRDELRLGSNTQNLEEFNILHATITGISEDALPTYLTHKNNQIQALRIEEEYYKDLKNPMKQKEVKEELNRLTRFYNALDIASKGDDKDLIKELILNEEFSQGQQERIKKMFDESKKEEEILDNSEKELIKATDDTEGAAKDQVEVVKELIDQENAENPQVTDVEDSLEMNHPHYDNLRTMNKGTKINYNGQILTLGDTTKTNISTEEGVVFTPKGVVISGQLTPYSGQLSKVDTSKVDTSEKVDSEKVEKPKPSSKPLFEEMKKDKELTTKPNHIDGRYILKGSRYFKGFTYYILKSNGFQTVNVDENGNESFGKIVKFNREETFYSVDGEVVKEELPIVDDSIVEPVLDKQTIEEKILNIEKRRKEELSESLIGKEVSIGNSARPTAKGVITEIRYVTLVGGMKELGFHASNIGNMKFGNIAKTTEIYSEIQRINAKYDAMYLSETGFEKSNHNYDYLKTLSKGTKFFYNSQILTLGDTQDNKILTKEGVVFTNKGVLLDGQLTPYGDNLVRVVSPENIVSLDKLGLKIETEYSVQEIYDKLPLKLDDNLQDLWDTISETAKKIGIKVYFYDESSVNSGFMGIPEKESGGMFLPTENAIVLKNEGGYSQEYLNRVFIHELIHSVTTFIVWKVEQNNLDGLTSTQINAVRDLKRLYEAVKKDNNLENKYPLKNLDEFLAGLSLPEFVRELESKDKSFLDKIVGLILDILGIKNANQLTRKYLKDIMSDGTALKNSYESYRESIEKGKQEDSQEQSQEQTQEEKIKSFISSVKNDSLRAVLLTSIDRNLIEVTC